MHSNEALRGLIEKSKKADKEIVVMMRQHNEKAREENKEKELFDFKRYAENYDSSLLKLASQQQENAKISVEFQYYYRTPENVKTIEKFAIYVRELNEQEST